MRVLMLAPIWERVPPRAYGGIEVVVASLVDGLIARGIDVTLMASGDSTTAARLHSVLDKPLREQVESFRNPDLVQWAHVAEGLREASGRFDLIHNHAGELAMAFGRLIGTPMLTTFHGPPDIELKRLWSYYSSPFNSISRSAAQGHPPEQNMGVVYNGIDVESFPFEPVKSDDLLFLSRISPEKGPLEAIQVARLAGRRLILAGKIDFKDRAFFEQHVKPMIDDDQIVFVGEADYASKRHLYARSAALLFPISWPEPFGLVMVEAAACGTPVLAFPRGAASEIVVDGVTGFLPATVEEMAACVPHLSAIDPLACRRHVVDHFSAEAMVEGYLDIYRRLIHRPSIQSPEDRGRGPAEPLDLPSADSYRAEKPLAAGEPT